MPLKTEPCRGTRDFFPHQQREQEYLFEQMRRAARLFGYVPYNTPLIEELRLYREKSGEELVDEQIYSFEDRGGRLVAIRPEMTPGLARMVAQVYKECAKPLRWYSIPNLMRYERPQKGRLREHWQFNADIFGAPEGQGEFEILQLVQTFLEDLGADKSHFKILINDRKIVDYVFKNLMSCDDQTARKLYKIIDKAKKITKQKFEEMLKALSLSRDANKFLRTYLELSSFEDLFKFLGDGFKSSLKHLLPKAKEVSLDQYLYYDPTIVRGLDYYTGVVFEVFDKSPETPRAICGGGSYDNLLAIFNEGPLAGVGLGLGEVTLKSFLGAHKLMPNFDKPQIDLLVAYWDESASLAAFSLARSLRQKDIKVMNHLGPVKFKKALAAAERNGADNVIFLGEREMIKKIVQVKNLGSLQVKEFSLESCDDIAGHLKRFLV